jgi:hypothetical protein
MGKELGKQVITKFHEVNWVDEPMGEEGWASRSPSWYSPPDYHFAFATE